MRALIYLMRTTIKNRILNLRKKPAYLVLYVMIVVVIVLMIISSIQTGSSVSNSKHYSDIRVLYAIVAGIGAIFLFSFVNTGLSTGSTLFTMADVGLLFVAPISTRKILIYGLIKQMTTTFLSAIFIFYQIHSIRSSFGLGFGAIFSLFLVYAIVIFFCQLLSIGIYIYTNGNKRRKNLISLVLYGLFLLTALGIYVQYLQNDGSIFNALLNLMDYKPFQFMPVVGWSVLFMSAAVEGNVVSMVLSLVLFLISSIIIISMFTTGEADYYEDVLVSTEMKYNRLQDVKNGKRAATRKKVKIKKEQVGLQGGKGYNAIFYKHLLEQKRTSRFLFLDSYTVLAAAGAGILCYFMKSTLFILFLEF